MEDTNTDLRVIRTKESIRHALVELINEKGFEAITVKDITTRAKINRGTFYTHYQDKFDLMMKYEEEIFLEISKVLKKNFSSIIAAFGTNSLTETHMPLVVSIFEYLNENSEFMKAMLSPKGDLSFQERLKDIIWKTLFGSNSDALFKEENLLVPEHYLASYAVSAHIGVIQQWLNNGRKESAQDMARILWTITANGPLFAAGLKK
ncbi:TetR/AcrR family transcriptional regulator [Metabacillus fastidiosus]|uniref:TetR/AcrR family transcriptional regulator n=1 Tax=Metabacillus fastidiosus TaxID=1458 RepID=UPI003D28B9D7